MMKKAADTNTYHTLIWLYSTNAVDNAYRVDYGILITAQMYCQLLL